MLARMIEGWVLWLVVGSVAVGALATWVLLVRLRRDESEIDAHERALEAAWIAATIEHHGGVAPQTFVQEVLELHQAYLRAPTGDRVPAESQAPPAPSAATEAATMRPPGPPA